MRQRYEQADTLTRLGDTHHAAGNDGAARDAWAQAQAVFENLQHPGAEHVRLKLKALTQPGIAPDLTSAVDAGGRPFGKKITAYSTR